MKSLLFFTLFFSCCASASDIWVFFDLGDTIISTSNGQTQYLQKTKNYLQELKENKIHLGLISNIPDSWGATYEQKLTRLKKYVADTWNEEGAFNWDDFELVLIPETQEEAKPSPVLFQRAQWFTRYAGAKIIFQGENPSEVQAAQSLGIPAYQVGQQESFYLSIEDIYRLTQ